MIPILMAYTPKGRTVHLKRHYLQGGIAAINISSMTILGLEPPGRLGKWEAEITLATAPPLDQFQPGMQVMLRNASNANIVAAPLKRVDNANSKIVLDIPENITQGSTLGAANVIPWGVCQLQNDTFDGTIVKNNLGDTLALQYDEVGEFIVKLEKQDLGNDLIAFQVCVTNTVTIAIQVSLDGCNWNTPDNWTNIVVAADGVAFGGVSACPYGYNKIFYFNNVSNGWLRITTSDLGTSGTYFINMAT